MAEILRWYKPHRARTRHAYRVDDAAPGATVKPVCGGNRGERDHVLAGIAACYGNQPSTNGQCKWCATMLAGEPPREGSSRG